MALVSMNHVTQVKRKLVQRLWDELPPRLIDADAYMNDGITTPPPYEINTTERYDLGGLPSLQLIVTDSSPQKNSYAQVYRHRIVIGVTVGGDVEETITTQIERYLWVVRQIMRDLHITPIEGTGPSDTGSEQYTPMQQRPHTVESPFVKGGFLEVFVTTVE